MERYARYAGLFKALSDPNRLMIVDMLSCGELCACKILERFDITQPTLSHHMKILCDCGLVSGRKAGKWTYYSLVEKAAQDFKDFLNAVITAEENCVCGADNNEECC
ncbi:MAG: metalloregulator ArsR/SmtB family transcription factor [Deltaproteobacteria bacterium]|jgi:ArsR family transcriptional regulator|nr:metalloregulator ArsR/SmtB family transcription factor [Deltaproteobacteria bacterium]